MKLRRTKIISKSEFLIVTNHLIPSYSVIRRKQKNIWVRMRYISEERLGRITRKWLQEPFLGSKYLVKNEKKNHWIFSVVSSSLLSYIILHNTFPTKLCMSY